MATEWEVLRFYSQRGRRGELTIYKRGVQFFPMLEFEAPCGRELVRKWWK